VFKGKEGWHRFPGSTTRVIEDAELEAVMRDAARTCRCGVTREVLIAHLWRCTGCGKMNEVAA
jgi:hypothetical protein